VIVR